MTIDKQALREEFRFMQVHYSDPADRARQVIYIAAEALLDDLDVKEEQRANWFKMAQKLGEDLDAAEKRNAEQREYYEGVIADGSKRIAELEKGHQEAAKQINSWRRLAKQNIAERGKDISELEAARQRIAELEASHSKLRDTIAAIHNTIRMDGGYTPLAAILNAAKRAYEESASTAGIGVKQQEDSVDSDVGSRNQPGMVVAVHIGAGDFVKVKGQVFEVEETDFDDHDVTLWFVGSNALKCAAGCPVEVVSAPVAAGIKVKGE